MPPLTPAPIIFIYCPSVLVLASVLVLKKALEAVTTVLPALILNIPVASFLAPTILITLSPSFTERPANSFPELSTTVFVLAV